MKGGKTIKTQVKEVEVFNKRLDEITHKDRYIYEKMEELPEGIILIDLKDDTKTRYGRYIMSDEAENTAIILGKQVVLNKTKN